MDMAGYLSLAIVILIVLTVAEVGALQRAETDVLLMAAGAEMLEPVAETPIVPPTPVVVPMPAAVTDTPPKIVATGRPVPPSKWQNSHQKGRR